MASTSTFSIISLILIITINYTQPAPSFYYSKGDIWSHNFGLELANKRENQLINIVNSLRVCLVMLNAFGHRRKTVNLIVEEFQKYFHNFEPEFENSPSPSWIFSNPDKFKRDTSVRKLGQNCFLFINIPDPNSIEWVIWDKAEHAGSRYYAEYVKQTVDFYFVLAPNTDDTLYVDPTDERSRPHIRVIGDRHPDFIVRHPFNYLLFLMQNSLYGPMQTVIQFKFKCGAIDFCTPTISPWTIKQSFTSHKNTLQYFTKTRRNFEGSIIQVGTWYLWEYLTTKNLKKLEKLSLRQTLKRCQETDGNCAPLKSALHLVNHVNGTPEGVIWGVQSDYKKNKGIIQFRHYYLKHKFFHHCIYYGSYHWLILYGENFELDRPFCFMELVKPIEMIFGVTLAIFIFLMVAIFKIMGLPSKSSHFGFGSLLLVLSPLVGQVGSRPKGSVRFVGKILFIVWILAAFFVDNYYLGNMHSLIMIPGTRPVLGKGLKDLLKEGYTINPFHPSHVQYYEHQLEQMKKGAGDSSWGGVFKDYDLLLKSLNRNDDPFTKERYRQIYGRDKSAILLSTDELLRDEKLAPALFQRNFYKSKQIFWQQSTTWIFDAPNVDALLTPFRGLLQGGIIEYWWNWRSYFYVKTRKEKVMKIFENEPEQENLKEQENDQSENGFMSQIPKPIKLQEPLIKVSFYLIALGLIVGFTCFVVEILIRVKIILYCWIHWEMRE